MEAHNIKFHRNQSSGSRGDACGWPGRKADRWPPVSVEAYNWWSYTATLPYVFMLCTAITLPFAVYVYIV
jgi:hypothetical protein